MVVFGNGKGVSFVRRDCAPCAVPAVVFRRLTTVGVDGT